MNVTVFRLLTISLAFCVYARCVYAQQTIPSKEQSKADSKAEKRAIKANEGGAKDKLDAKHTKIEAMPPSSGTEDFTPFGIYENTARMPAAMQPVATQLPLPIHVGDRIMLIGNTLLERSQEFGRFEAYLQQKFSTYQLKVRHLAWSADTVDTQPRPANFANTMQHLTHEQADVIFAAYGFNESFAGDAGLALFRAQLAEFLADLKGKSYNGVTAPRVVLVSPIANENVASVNAADKNNSNIKQYVMAMRDVAADQSVGFVDVFTDTQREMESPGSDLTINGVHLNAAGDEVFSRSLFRRVFGEEPPKVNEELLKTIVDKNRQFFRRFRPLNTFYYTGGRNKDHGYLDFLPAMRNFDLMVANRDKRIWDMVQGKPVLAQVDDSNVPPLPKTPQSRGANEWLSAEEEQKAFKMDPRFEVNLFAGEEQFPKGLCSGKFQS